MPGGAAIIEEAWPDAEEACRRAAGLVAELARRAEAARGRFLLAVSGGETPRRLLRLLVDEDIPWARVHLFQVDERLVPDGHADRNLTLLRESLLSHLRVPPAGVHAMPVEDPDPARVASAYSATLSCVAGDPPVLDLVHLGLGEDGHTASLVAGDPAEEVQDRDVAAAGPYRGTRRLTLTFPILNRSRSILWLVTGAAKGPALARLRLGDRGIPAGRVRRDRARVIVDAAADRASRPP